MAIEHFDVLIVGAGISGISAAWHLNTHCPGKRYALLEGRERVGGTWDLFRYPGIRSDSDMYTFGFSFRPWLDRKAIASAPAILGYLDGAVADYGIAPHIRFSHQVKRAAWSSERARWTLDVERGPQQEVVRMSCDFLFMCSGYYRYSAGYTPDFPGMGEFKGRIVHPQHWGSDIDYKGKRVIVIGSGATAATLVPELAAQAAHVVMLQRSPTYMVARPAVDPIAQKLQRWFPERLAYTLTRWKNVLFGMYVYQLCKRKPAQAKAYFIKMMRDQLGPDYDVATHFTPSYNPWEQRVCLVPDGDLFKAIREGRASVVTDHIDRFTEQGLLLKSGKTIEADLIVTATGLELQMLGGTEVSVDGQAVDFSQKMSYKGMMFNEVPNLVSVFGYTNASWTLKADLTCKYFCRVMNHMQATGTRQCMPHLEPGTVTPAPWVDFSSGYFLRAADRMPKQGTSKPWRLYQNYALDILSLRFGRVEDGTMQFK